MFNQEFFPTPPHVIELMCEGLTLEGKTILEPSAGKGDIVNHLNLCGAHVLTCEKNEDLQEILKSKSTLIEGDFFKVTPDKISHIHAIIMNPPFSNADDHILHAFNIAPPGCIIISLCNSATLKNQYSNRRKQLHSIVDSYGLVQDIGNPFEESERRTDVNTSMIRINKPGGDENTEFEGFFMDEEPETANDPGMMKYNFIRDVVNRYVEAVKIFDEQLNAAEKMNNITSSFYYSKLAFHCSSEDKPVKRNEFKKDLQKSAWKFIFSKMNFGKFTTQGLREDINKFVEQQSEIPFTMRNIYKMLEIVIGTTGQRMDKALLEVFDKLTTHYHDNRMNVPGWKTNSHFLVNRRFIFPYGSRPSYKTGIRIAHYERTGEILIDLEKALCFLMGENYDEIKGIYHLSDSLDPGQWYDTHFFKIRGYKKGTVHCEFKDADTWGKFNQRIAKIKGFPLYEHKTQTRYQNAQTRQNAPERKKSNIQANTLFEITL